MLVICDIDGCLADIVYYYKKYLTGHPKDWKGFYSHTLDFLPIKVVFNLVNSLIASGSEVVFVSGRPESNRDLTSQWLRTYLEPTDDSQLILYLRQRGDTRKSSVLKLELYNKLRSSKPFRPVLVIDDELTTVELASREGFTTLQVHGFRTNTRDDVPEEV